MSFLISTGTHMGDVLAQINAFLIVGHSHSIDYTQLGASAEDKGELVGTIGTTNSVAETITVTFTSPTSYTVTGSVTGSHGTGVVGAQLTTSVVKLIVSPGTIAFASGDKITFKMTRPWTLLRMQNLLGPPQDAGIDLGLASQEGDEYIWKAPGNSDQDEIFVGLRRQVNNIGDYDNFQTMGAIGYNPLANFEGQPQATFNSRICGLRIGTIPFWIIADGDRMILVLKITTIFTSCYLGFINTYWRKEQYPYPLAVCGNLGFSTPPALTSGDWRFSNTTNRHRMFPKSINALYSYRDDCGAMIRDHSGVWFGCGSNRTGTSSGSISDMRIGFTFPWAMDYFTRVLPNLDETYSLFPTSLSVLQPGSRGIENSTLALGEYIGVFAVSGYGNGSENIVLSGKQRFIVIQDIFRTTAEDYMALRLE